MKEERMEKNKLLNTPIEHIDIKKINTTELIEAMAHMSFSARATAQAAYILEKMLTDPHCGIILTIAGSSPAAGCMQIYIDMVRSKMADVVVATGATIVDMDFFEALGFKHYRGTPDANDKMLRDNYIDRIYDTYIDEVELQECDRTIKEIAAALPARAYSSREFIAQMGKYLTEKSKKSDSLVQACYEMDVPIFCPAFSDSSAGFGLVLHQAENKEHVSIDSVKDFHELTQVKIKANKTGLFMVGGGVPKNFAQDTVICAEVLGKQVPMHEYAVQITVADVRDGACSSSTLKEASSWGKVDTVCEQMVYAEATTVLPLIISYVYHKESWKKREPRRFSKLFKNTT
jgi:deoxyhypusine synthase